MTTDHRSELRKIRAFPQLVRYLRDEMGWPIVTDDFEELTFDYSPEELGIDAKNAAKIQDIKRLRPFSPNQPWGIFFVKFEPRRLPVVALRRILSRVVLKKQASANPAERTVWAADDLLFVSNYGEGDERQISFAHFSRNEEKGDLPTLKVLGWDNRDTMLHLDGVADKLTRNLAWPKDEHDIQSWRQSWRSAFTLRNREVITTSRELSIRLAELARTIRDRIRTVLSIETERGPLTKLMNAFKEALIHDLDAEGFADMYAQTIAYGLLSARIANPKANTADHLPAQIPVTNPFLKELMGTFLKVGGRRNKIGEPHIDFDELGVSDVVELLDDANMEAIICDFGDKNPQEDPVIHFYELFLKEYDAKKRMQRGVFYTPRSVVAYIVRSVDELLHKEFGLEHGLADTTTWGEMAKRNKELRIPDCVSPDQSFVQILDPATGTGTFLVEVIDVIHRTLVAEWKRQGFDETKIETLWNQYVPKDLLPRLHGYELQMAPYAIAHLKIGLKLYETGYGFESNERVRIFLTNSLEPASDAVQQKITGFTALAREAKAVSEVKRKQRFTVVVGNPPYSGVSVNMAPWIDGLLKGVLPGGMLTASYYHVDGESLGERKLWLQDDYVKFIRLSQWLLEQTGCGIHGFITNHGYLDNPTFRGMRWSIMRAFNEIFVLDLHGNLMKKESPPDGGKDVNVFDIQQGVAVSMFVKRRDSSDGKSLAVVNHCDLWGEREEKYRILLGRDHASMSWLRVDRAPPFYLFKPFDSSEVGDYNQWPTIADVMPVSVTGVVTARDGFVVDFDSDPLIRRIQTFMDTRLSDSDVQGLLGLKENYAWRVKIARKQLVQAVRRRPLEEFIKPYLYRPFDERLIFWDPSVVWRPRLETMPHMFAGKNCGLIYMRQVALGDAYSHFGVSRVPVDNRAFYSNKGIMSFAPLYLYPDVGRGNRLKSERRTGKCGRYSNLDIDFVHALEQFTGLKYSGDGRGDLDRDFGPEDVLAYIYSVFHSPEYRQRYEQMLKLDFPRVPLPGNRESFASLVCLGHELLAIHLLESPRLGKFITSYKGPKNPTVEEAAWCDGTVWLDGEKANAGEGHHALKPGTIGFSGVPKDVWDFHMGGYQACHKWLKDRKGRKLSAADIAHYQSIVVAIRETLRIMGEIDQAIDVHGGWLKAFQTGNVEDGESSSRRTKSKVMQSSLNT